MPDGVWDETSRYGDLRGYKRDTGDGLYRRSLYTYWKRAVPPPGMMTFDAAGREACVVRENRTNTPLQALNLMNDPLMLEASRTIAQQILKQNDLSLPQKLEAAFRKVAARKPSKQELQVLEKHVAERQQQLGNQPDRAKQLIKIGESPVDEKIDPIVSAAIMEAVALVYNMDDVVCK
jgi:hypothetical protein